jgi:hypothetical protein
MSWQEYSLGLIEALALPGVVLILGLLFFRPLRAISRRVQDDLAAGKALQIGAGGVLVGITERDDYHAQWYKPYQLRLAATERATPPDAAEEPPADPLRPAPQHDDARPPLEQIPLDATQPPAHP